MTERTARNVLFIMCDQLRYDYLSCAGHPHLPTPNIDALAARGVRFTQAYCQSPVCGPSRMSFYTGRYMRSHGANWNNYPLRVGEFTLGDYLRELDVRTALVGKTHMQADFEGMTRLGIDPDSPIGVLQAECGFEPYERDDGLHPDGPRGRYDARPTRYDDWLRELGYDSDNPWEEWANSGEDEDGRLLSGWLMKNSRKAARVAEEHSETAYMTDRAMDFIREAGEERWCLHLSYIKPHWPYIAPAPYHDMFGPEHVVPAVRDAGEREDAHPLMAGFQSHQVGRAFARQGVRETVIPAYMGLVKQIDDHLGRLFDFLDAEGRMDDTLIVFTSDHGDYLGDHWLGEKDLFHDCSVKIPLIVVDPAEAADPTRGTTCDALVESIDLVPTFVVALGGEPQTHRMEGVPLQPLLHDEPVDAWRTAAISEYDYSLLPSGARLQSSPSDCLIFMAADQRWKYIEPVGYPPLLFDRLNDPDELRDVAGDPANAAEIDRLRGEIDAWARRPSQRVTVSDAAVFARRGASSAKGILIGVWDEDDLSPEVSEFLRDRGRL